MLSVLIFDLLFFVCVLKPVTSRNPLSDTIGSVLIWHMYHPWSDGLRSFIVNCQRSPSRSTTEIRGFRVITLASIVKMVWVRTLIHDIWNFKDKDLIMYHISCTCKSHYFRCLTLSKRTEKFENQENHYVYPKD